LALSAPPRPADALLVEVEGQDGRPRLRLSANVAGAGMNGRVVELANESNKEWGGLVTFASATVRAVIERRITEVAVRYRLQNGIEQQWTGRLAASFFANGAYCGNGMWLGRGGSMQDGQFEMTLIPELPALRMLVGVPRLYLGTVDRIPEVVRATVVNVELSSSSRDVMVDLDGELAGHLPLKIRMIPKVLLVATGLADF
ncbi:MAG: hypothetical protein AAGA48_25725, partial [Myxococcota bacterium]